jgi:hypothetical protein
MIHDEAHPLAGKTVLIKEGTVDPAQSMVVGGAEYRIEDWWDRLGAGSWQDATGNFAAIHYTYRAPFNGLPKDDEVVYGKIGRLGHIVHVSELGELVEEASE